MRLVSCHIENFGQISKQDISFDRDLHVILEDNGWGKSTLATFLRVMFYGFDNESKRGVNENERKHFSPWQSGTYGGSVTFEANGKQYCVERTFGNKKGEDTFRLSDPATHLESGDYDEREECLGRQLFGIDSESFRNTAFVPQLGSGVTITSQISAKIGSLSAQTGDMSGYDRAQKLLKEELDHLTEKRNTGEIFKKKVQINDLQTLCGQKRTLEEKVSRLQKEVEDQERLVTRGSERVKELQEEIRAEGKRLELLGKREKQELLEESLEKAKSQAEKLRQEMPAEIPEKEELEEIVTLAAGLEAEERAARGRSLSEDEVRVLERYGKIFGAGVPKEEELKQAEIAFKTYERLHKKEQERSLSA